MSDQDDKDPQQKPRLPQVLQSALAALFGVQSNANRERDFNKGQASDYIGVFVVLVIVLVIAMIVVVKLVLSSASS